MKEYRIRDNPGTDSLDEQQAMSRSGNPVSTPPTPPVRKGQPRCIIVGCGGHGRVVLDVLLNADQHEIVGFVDSNPKLLGRRIDGVEVLGRPDDVQRIRHSLQVDCAIVAIGDNGVRRQMARRMEEEGLELINAVHPSANLARNVSLGSNVVIAAGALVCAHCQIGDSVILNTGCIVDHESLIGTATHVCPGARLAGRVIVESGAFVGIGATVIQHVRVGHDAVIGAGAVVIHDVEPMTTVVGVPARPVKEPSPEDFLKSWLVPEFAPTTGPTPAATPLPALEGR
jgi:sugar O-acyltransferase (sialic acid O-acetyltransferase NeuD family)